jgi:hypothetical protein
MSRARQAKQVKNTVVTAKCKLSREECKDANCPVHGEPNDEAPGPAPATKGAEKLEAAEEEGRRIAATGHAIPITAVEADESLHPVDLPGHVLTMLREAHDTIKHIQHQNDFTRDLLRRMENVLEPPPELMTIEEARRRLGVGDVIRCSVKPDQLAG